MGHTQLQHLRQQAQHVSFGDQLALNLDALPEAGDVGGHEEACVQPGYPQALGHL